MVMCESFNCLHNKQSTCTRQSVSIDSSGVCIGLEYRSDSIWITSMIEKIPKDKWLPNFNKTLDEVTQETLKACNAVGVIKFYIHPTQKQPYLAMLLQTHDGKRKMAIIHYQPKGEQ